MSAANAGGLLSSPWLLDAVVSGGSTSPACCQLLDLQPSPTPGASNCVLSDKAHSIGAVLTPESVQQYLQRNPSNKVARLDGGVVMPVRYELSINQLSQQFTMRVLEFEFLGWSRSVMISRPRCVMDEPRAVARLAAAVAHIQMPPPAGPAPAAPTPEPYVQRIARRGYPFACAACPVEALAPHRLISPLLVIPHEQEDRLRQLLRAAESADGADAGSSEHTPASVWASTATGGATWSGDDGASPACESEAEPTQGQAPLAPSAHTQPPQSAATSWGRPALESCSQAIATQAGACSQPPPACSSEAVDETSTARDVGDAARAEEERKEESEQQECILGDPLGLSDFDVIAASRVCLSAYL